MITNTMLHTEILKRLTRIVTRQLGIRPSEVSADARLREDLGADLLDLVELIMAIGCEFGQDVLDEDMKDVHTLGELASYIEQRCAGMRERVYA